MFKTNVEERNDEIITEELEDNTAEDGHRDNEEDSGAEAEVEIGGDLSPEDGGDGDAEGDDHREGREARKDRAKAQIDRLKEENKRLKEENRKAKKESGLSPQSTDMMSKAYLAAAHGINEPDAQEEALRLADKFDMTVDDLMEDADYKSRVASLQKRVVQQRKVASSTGSAAQRKKTAEYAMEYFQKNQSFPDGTPLETRSKAIDLMTKRKNTWG